MEPLPLSPIDEQRKKVSVMEVPRLHSNEPQFNRLNSTASTDLPPLDKQNSADLIIGRPVSNEPISLRTSLVDDSNRFNNDANNIFSTSSVPLSNGISDRGASDTPILYKLNSMPFGLSSASLGLPTSPGVNPPDESKIFN